MSEDYKYTGAELKLFSQAEHWKKYVARHIKPYIKGKVLEVGAGLGRNTKFLNDGTATAWLLLEPDQQMAATLEREVQEKIYPPNCRSKKGTIADIDQQFDTIIYIDVLEHIEDDAAELQKASSLLNDGGHIIVLGPAFRHLFSPFDKAIGHYRRYTGKTLKALTPDGCEVRISKYYDSAGYFASLMNKIFLKQKYPTVKQVNFWDKFLVPLSRITDLLFFHTFGKSILVAWRK